MTQFLQGAVGVRDYNNPTLVPNLDQGVITNGIVGAQSPAQYLVNNPRTDALANGLVGGSITNGDTVSLTVTLGTLPGGSETVTYVAGSSDTTTTVAEGIANAINNDANLSVRGIIAELGAVGHPTQFIIHANGPVGNFATLSASVSGSATETITFGQGTVAVGNASGTATIGGSSFVSLDVVALTLTNAAVVGLPITNSFTLGAGESATTIATGLKNLVNGSAPLTAANIKATSSGTVVTITQPGTIGNTTVMTRAVTGSGDETVTFSNSGTLASGTGTPGATLTGGTGPVIAVSNFRFAYNGSVVSAWYGKPYLWDQAMISLIVSQAINMPSTPII